MKKGQGLILELLKNVVSYFCLYQTLRSNTGSLCCGLNIRETHKLGDKEF